MQIQDSGSLLAQLINPRQYKISHFIHRNKTPRGYEYTLVPEILNLEPKELYGPAMIDLSWEWPWRRSRSEGKSSHGRRGE
jgi:hypothetical protein